jgi:transcriptional regulator with XRE-family HTH domain
MQLSQEQLAEMLKLSVQQVRNYESGRCRPSLERLYDLPCTMKISVESLMLTFSTDK